MNELNNKITLKEISPTCTSKCKKNFDYIPGNTSPSEMTMTVIFER